MNFKKTASHYSCVGLLFAILLTLVACDTNQLYDQSAGIHADGWHKDTVAVFEVEVTDTTTFYNFYINVRNNDDYAFRNLYLFLTTRMPNNNRTRDTLELILADPQGNWLGKGFGALHDNQILVRRNLSFPLAGSYTFSLQQAMRQDVLKGITDAGIRIEQSR
jgi:gliding motility-associated lipoprotein GldH